MTEPMTPAERDERLATELSVYVPSTDAPSVTLLIDPGSGIVGEELENGRILLYYEGDRYDAMNIETFADRASHARGETLDEDALLTTSGKGARRREFQVVLDDPSTDAATRQWVEQEARRQGLR